MARQAVSHGRISRKAPSLSRNTYSVIISIHFDLRVRCITNTFIRYEKIYYHDYKDLEVLNPRV